MKSLIEIKNEVAKDHGYIGWLDMMTSNETERHLVAALADIVSKRYASEALRESIKQIIEQQGSKEDGQVYRFSCTEIILELINELK